LGQGLRAHLGENGVSLGLVFISPRHFEKAPDILENLRLNARVPLLVGCSSTSLIAGSAEIEEHPGVALGLYALPGAHLKPARFTQEQLEEQTGPAYWHLQTEVTPEQTNGWLAFADPFSSRLRIVAALVERSLRARADPRRSGQRRSFRASHPTLSQWRCV
jgi:small ligand-binding sensory domain FIST